SSARTVWWSWTTPIPSSPATGWPWKNTWRRRPHRASWSWKSSRGPPPPGWPNRSRTPPSSVNRPPPTSCRNGVCSGPPHGMPKQLTQAGARLLVDLVGTEMGQLDQELTKLAVYVGNASRIDTPDVDQLVGNSRAANTFKILDAIAA